MNNKLLLLLAVILCWGGQQLYAQYDHSANKVWVFGSRSGIDFNGATPVSFNSNVGTANGVTIASQEGSATVCDDNGHFLFHTNGTQVWDSTATLMPHGANIPGIKNAQGTDIYPTYSTSQAAVITNVPDSAGQYFIFSLGSWDAGDLSHLGKLFCTKVRMDLNNGRGDVDTTFPLYRKVLDSVFMERMALVAADCHIWLVLSTRDTNGFKAFRVTNEGIDPNPVVSYVGNFPRKVAAAWNALHYRQGSLKVSPNGRILVNAMFRANASAGAGLEIYDFDYETGVVSNARIIDEVGYFAADFSPDNSKLYATANAANNATNQVYQFDLSKPDSASIRSSKFAMGVCSFLGDIRLAPNGKIYFPRRFGGYTAGNLALCSIEKPNEKGAAAEYKDSALLLATGTGILIGLPHVAVVQNRRPGITATVVLDSNLCNLSEPLILSVPENSSHVAWNDGSESDSIEVNKFGTYYVYYRNQKNCAFTDTFKVSIADLPDWYITIDEMVLRSSHSFDTYQWYKDGEEIPGATASSLEVDENAVYMLKVTLGECEDTSSYKVTNVNGIEGVSGIDSRVRVYPNPVYKQLSIEAPFPVSVRLFDLAGREVLQLANVTYSINLESIKEGLYLIRVQNEEHNFFYGGTILKK